MVDTYVRAKFSNEKMTALVLRHLIYAPRHRSDAEFAAPDLSEYCGIRTLWTRGTGLYLGEHRQGGGRCVPMLGYNLPPV